MFGMVLTEAENCTISHRPNDKSIKDILKAVKIAEIKNKKLFRELTFRRTYA